MANGRWAVDRPKEAGLRRPIESAPVGQRVTYRREPLSHRIRNAARINRQESMDRCTPLGLGFDRERPVQDFHPLTHAD